MKVMNLSIALIFLMTVSYAGTVHQITTVSSSGEDTEMTFILSAHHQDDGNDIRAVAFDSLANYSGDDWVYTWHLEEVHLNEYEILFTADEEETQWKLCVSDEADSDKLAVIARAQNSESDPCYWSLKLTGDNTYFIHSIDDEYSHWQLSLGEVDGEDENLVHVVVNKCPEPLTKWSITEVPN